LTDYQYRNAIETIFEGRIQPEGPFPAVALGSSATGFSTEPQANLLTKLGAEEILQSAEEVALSAAASISDEGGQSLLDNSLVLWISEFGDGGRHRTDDLPVILAGGLGGTLPTGRHLSFPGRTHNDLYTTILNLFGFEANAFGHPSSDFNNGPLPIL
jgi:hypothetical protein